MLGAYVRHCRFVHNRIVRESAGGSGAIGAVGHPMTRRGFQPAIRAGRDRMPRASGVAWLFRDPLSAGCTDQVAACAAHFSGIHLSGIHDRSAETLREAVGLACDACAC